MVERKSEWREAFTLSLPAALKRAGKKKTDLVKHFKGRASAQAVYKWATGGSISRENLNRLVAFLFCDAQTALMTGELVPKIELPPTDAIAEPRPSAHPDIPALIYRKVKRLDQTAQLTILQMIETMINIADPRYWEYISQSVEKELP